MPYNIQANFVLPKIKAVSKKQTFVVIAKAIAPHVPCSEEVLLEQFLNKEVLSGSGIGDGVAIPHLKIPQLQKRLIALITLSAPVDFNSVDDQPVDIVCILLSPETDGPLHLRGLSRISRRFKNKNLRERLRETKDATIIQSLFNDPEGWLIAA